MLVDYADMEVQTHRYTGGLQKTPRSKLEWIMKDSDILFMCAQLK